MDFTKLSDQIFVSEANVPAHPDHPDVVLIFGWGDAPLRNVAKYSVGYRKLFPGAKHYIILSAIGSTIGSTLEQRSAKLKPLINMDGKRILVHAMSNTGAITYSAFLNAHQKTDKPFPHDLLVLDSTPGTPYLSMDTLKRWSWAMTINTARSFPWPAIFTRVIWIVFLCINRLIEKILRRQSAAEFAAAALKNPLYETLARRLFLYGRDDYLISHNDIEDYAAESRVKGYAVNLVEFQGTGHVEHFRKHEDKYLNAIDEAWKDSRRDEEA